MTVSPTPDFVEVLRTITLVEGTTPTPVDVNPPTVRFRGQLSPPTARRTGEGSPRETEPKRFLRWSTYVSPVELKAGERVMVNGDIFEVMTNSRPISRGFRPYGVEVELVPVDDLYPHVATVVTQEGAILGVTAVALWAPREHHEDRGDYEDRDGEAPIENASIISRNTSLRIGTERWRVLTSTVQIYPLCVLFTARRAGG